MKGHSGRDAESKGGNKTIAFVLLLDRCLFKRIHQEMGDRITACTPGNVGRASARARRQRQSPGGPAADAGGQPGGGIPREGGRPEKRRRRARWVGAAAAAGASLTEHAFWGREGCRSVIKGS